MNTYKVSIKFKQGKSLEFDIDTDENLKVAVPANWSSDKKEGALTIGEYLIATDDIQWIRIKGETLKKDEIVEK